MAKLFYHSFLQKGIRDTLKLFFCEFFGENTKKALTFPRVEGLK